MRRLHTAWGVAALVVALLALVAAPASAGVNPLLAARTSVTPEDFGAVGDGVADDQAALQRALAAAGPTTQLVVAAGRTYRHSGVLTVTRDGTRVTGGGTLLASDQSASSIFVDADHVTLDRGLVLRLRAHDQRLTTWEATGLRAVAGHTGLVLRDVMVVGQAAAGVYLGGVSSFLLQRVWVADTGADGIHMTDGSHDGRVLDSTTTHTGDDGFAVVSYRADVTPTHPPCHDILVQSPHVLGNTWGRGVSVVGGTRITYRDIDVRDTSAAGVYIAAEQGWDTVAPQQVLVDGGRVVHADLGTAIQGAVLVVNERSDLAPSDVTIRGLAISRTPTSLPADVALVTYGRQPQRVRFEDITITGGPPAAISTNVRPGRYATVGWTQDGVVLPDHLP